VIGSCLRNSLAFYRQGHVNGAAHVGTKIWEKHLYERKGKDQEGMPPTDPQTGKRCSHPGAGQRKFIEGGKSKLKRGQVRAILRY